MPHVTCSSTNRAIALLTTNRVPTVSTSSATNGSVMVGTPLEVRLAEIKEKLKKIMEALETL